MAPPVPEPDLDVDLLEESVFDDDLLDEPDFDDDLLEDPDFDDDLLDELTDDTEYPEEPEDDADLLEDDTADLPEEPEVERTLPRDQPPPPTEDEEKKKRRGLILWLIPLILALALIAGLIWLVAAQPWNPVVTPTPTPTTTSASTPEVTPTPEPTPTPTPEITPTPTPTPEPTTTAPPPSTTQPAATTSKPPATKPATTAPATTAPASTKPATTAPGGAAAAKISSIDAGPSGMYFPIIRGTGEPGDTISISVGNSSTTVTVDAKGKWMASGFESLSPGNHKVTVRGKQNSTASSSSFTLASLNASISSTAAGANVTLRGVSGGLVQVIIDGSKSLPFKLDGSGSAFGELSLLPGQHSISVRYQDGARTGPTQTVNITVN